MLSFVGIAAALGNPAAAVLLDNVFAAGALKLQVMLLFLLILSVVAQQ